MAATDVDVLYFGPAGVVELQAADAHVDRASEFRCYNRNGKICDISVTVGLTAKIHWVSSITPGPPPSSSLEAGTALLSEVQVLVYSKARHTKSSFSVSQRRGGRAGECRSVLDFPVRGVQAIGAVVETRKKRDGLVELYE